MAMIKLDPKKTPPPAPAKDEDEDTNTYEGLSLVGEIDGRKLFIENHSLRSQDAHDASEAVDQ